MDGKAGGYVTIAHLRGTEEPIAIVGIGCRFPGGANDPDAFWELLKSGRNAVTEIPADRWNLKRYYDKHAGVPGRTNSRWAGFIEGIEQFDAEFFGIAPREAARMDPQQRILLEVTWEALEDAGIDARRLAGTPTGVFVGLSSLDYMLLQNASTDLSTIDAHSNTGNAMSIAANRISYIFDLRGPSIAMDTACSSSLAAIHQACESLRNGDCSAALAGGVNVLIKPEAFIGFSRASMLAADGRCKAFDSRADGFVRGEGAGVVVLKPLSAAVRDGDRIYAVIRGSAVNQDGRTKGITVPNEEAQLALVREACRRAGIDPDELQYVEAHGTGTPVGDPIEARALGRARTNGKPGRECLIGSVKTNIGHLEPAAGVAGLIKTALALRGGAVPASLHFEKPNPAVPFGELGLRIPTRLEAWPRREGDGPDAYAGVNSFGFGGTNAHVVLSRAPNEPTATASSPSCESPVIITLAAKNLAALKALAGNWKTALSASGSLSATSLHNIAHSAAFRRTHHDERLAIVARTHADAAEAIGAFLDGGKRPDYSHQRAREKSPKLAFVFSGQGPQWWGMGGGLLRSERVFRETIERCDAVIRQLGDWSLLNEMSVPESASRMQQTAIAQPAIFAVQAGLAALYASWGIRPDIVVGHSVGEVAAALAAGAFDLDDATRVIFHRGHSMEQTRANGGMLAAALSADEARAEIARYDGAITLAAVNGPHSVTISGDREALVGLQKDLESRNIFCRALRVSHAFHSSHMDPAEAGLRKALASIQPRETRIPMISTVTGALIDGRSLNAEYWWQNVRKPVQFHDAVRALHDAASEVFLELSPHPVLKSSISECLESSSSSKSAVVLHTLHREHDEPTTARVALGGLHGLGRAVDWTAVLGATGRFVPLPRYPWQHEKFWHEDDAVRTRRIGTPGHPLLGARSTGPTPTWENRLDARVMGYLRDHRVQGQLLLSGTCFLEMALAATRELQTEASLALEDVEFLQAGFLDDDRPRSIQLSLEVAEGWFEICGPARLTQSCDAAAEREEWTKFAVGHARPVPAEGGDKPIDLESLRRRMSDERSGEECYKQMLALGLEYGPTYRGIERLWAAKGEALAEVVAREGVEEDLGDYLLHPALLDACLQAICGAMPDTEANSPGMRVYLPTQVARVRLLGPCTHHVWSHARIVEWTGREISCDLNVYDDAGNPIAMIEGFRARALEDDADGRGLDGLLYEYRWHSRELTSTRDSKTHILRHAPRCEPSDVARAISEHVRIDPEFTPRHALYSAGLKPLCTSFILSAFAKLGWKPTRGQIVRVADFMKELRIVDRHARLIHRYLALLAEDGLLADSGEDWKVVSEPKPGDVTSEWRSFLAKFPSYYAELTLLANCGENLAEILRGEADPLQCIFPEGSLSTSEHLYQDSPSARWESAFAAESIAEVGRHLPTGRPLRVLEIGAGTGGLTAHVLPRLGSGSMHYVFTDLSRHFLNRAEQRFAGFTGVEYRILDIERDPLEQGFERHEFDVIAASQVLHATRDLRQTLRNVKTLLAPGGQLLLIEAIERHRWADVIFGLTEGWWRYTDLNLRKDYPLLTIPGWQKLLTEEGFSGPTEITGRDFVPNAVILARGPENIADDSTSVVRERHCEGNWLVFADHGSVGRRIAESLRAGGGHVQVVEPGPTRLAAGAGPLRITPGDADEMNALVSGFTTNCRGIIHAWACDAPARDGISLESLDVFERDGCLSLVQLCQSLSRADRSDWLRLFILTRGAQVVDESSERPALGQAAVIGLGRVVITEYPQLRAALVDVGAQPGDAEVEAVIAEIVADEREDEIAFRGDERFIRRYERRRPRRVRERIPYRFEISRPGVFDRLLPRPLDRHPPRDGEVEIEVHAAGVNFADVMKVLGIYPGLGAGPIPLGFECSGRVARVGRGVADFREGDLVYGATTSSYASHVLASADLIAKRPADMTHEDAATIPIAFLTAYYGLVYLARIQRGERVLIHAATGGVGLAAIQIAQRCGAEVFATAGSTPKRDFLRRLGIRSVMDSRSLAFVDQIREQTHGEGVDVVLNSLAGAGLVQSFGLLRNYGRFLEIGKRDIYANRHLGMAPFKRNASFMSIDLELGLRERRTLCAELFREIAVHVSRGAYRPLVHRAFPVSAAAAAMRHISQARHIGKVVLSTVGQDVRTVDRPGARLAFRDDATYLISGGLGGIGLAMSDWMADRGARHLVLMGRRGIHSPEAATAVDSLRARGVNVIVETADVCNQDDVSAMLDRIAANMPPLRGVIHAAMVLDDCLIHNLTPERLHRVMAPKIVGAWHLDRLTEKLPLDFFILFSSMTSVFGIGGQANYAAGNSFLDTLAFDRHARGLPGIAINWGSIEGVGYVAQRKEIIDRFAREGIRGLQPDEIFAALERLLLDDATQAGVVRLDWRNWRGFTQNGAPPMRFDMLIGASSGKAESTGSGGTGARQRFMAAPADARRNVLVELLVAQVARILGAAAEKLDPKKPLTELGLDSLMGVEIRNWIESELGASVPTVELMRGPSVEQLADSLMTRLGGDAGRATTAAPTKPAASAAPTVPTEARRSEPSFVQRRIWTVNRLAPAASAAMNNARAVRLVGDLNVARLEESLNRVIARHEALRTSIIELDAAPVQHIAPEARIAVRTVDLTNRPEAERESAARRIAAQEAARPFDLAVAPLMRFLVVRMSEREHLAVVALHHVVGDGWSSGVLMEEFLAAYAALTRGVEPAFPPLRHQYADFVAHQRETLAGPRGAALREFWTRKLDGIHPKPPTAPTAEFLASVTHHFELEHVAALRRIAQAEGCTLYALLLAAFMTALHRHTGETDLVVGSPQANRDGEGWANVVGFIANTLPVRVRADDNPTFRKLLGRVRAAVLEVQEHHDLPVELLLDEMRGPAAIGGDLFRVVFTLLNVPMPTLEIAGLQLKPEVVDPGVAGYDLSLILQEKDGRLEGEFTHRLTAINPSAAAQFLAEYRKVLEEVCARTDRPIRPTPPQAAAAGGSRGQR